MTFTKEPIAALNQSVAIMVLNYNGKHHLSECFNSLKAQTYENFEVYLVDNASSDGSVDFVKSSFPWVKIISFEQNLGFAKGYNQAILQVKSELIALLNNDTRVNENWLNELVLCIHQNTSIAAAGSKMLFYADSRIINHAGTKIAQVGGGYSMGAYELDNSNDAIQYVGAVCAGAMLIRRSVFLKVGGFDEHFFAYFEDVDLCWRIWLYGLKVMYCPRSIVFHKHGASFGKRSFLKTSLGVRNRLSTVIKNFELKNMIKGLVLSLFFDGLRVAADLRKKNDAIMARAVVKAYLFTVANFGQIYSKRQQIQHNRKVSDKTLYNLKLIATMNESISEYIKLNTTVKSN